MSSIIPSDFQKEELEKDQNCGFCGTLVGAGCSVCPACQAWYGTRANISKRTGCLIVAGIFLGGMGILIGLLAMGKNGDLGAGLIITCISAVLLFWSVKKVKNIKNQRTEKQWWKFGVSVN